METFIKNMVVLIVLIIVDLVLMTKIKRAILEISSGLITGVIVAVLGSEVYLFPWFSLFVLMVGLFTIANAIHEIAGGS